MTTIGGEVENLHHEEAIAKMQELVKHNPICLFTTNIRQEPLTARPMSAQHVDNAGNFWFLSPAESHKNEEIRHDPWVQLFFANPAAAEFLTLYGVATVSQDRKKIEELWTPLAKAWFKDGIDTPDITAICIKPEEAYYWDTKSSKMISMLKIIASAISGRTAEDGIEGRLQV
jgi:general stress protein 26